MCGETSASFSNDKSVVLEVRNANFSVKTSKGTKNILTDVNLSAESGGSYALMGPSGAGKTTFLELLTLGFRGGRASGSVTLNGEKLTFETFRQRAVYVEQYDTHWAFLTCRETMQYAAALYNPSDSEGQSERVSHVMTKLGLTECADAYAGNEFFKGMSGGQKKRLTLGMALLKAPVLMLLDEPTSGLDASSTASVMQALKDMCKEFNLIAIATIHQPSTEVFLGFDEVMFLASGRTAYCGKTQEVATYCESIGKPLPALKNPADWFIDLINSEFAGREAVDEIVVHWANRHVQAVRKDLPRLEGGLRQSRWQVLTVFSRQFLLAVRDPTLYLGRMGVFLMANCFFALIYWKARAFEQQYVFAKFYLIGWLIAVPTMLAVVVVFATNAEFHLVKKEIRNGLLQTTAYLVSTTFLNIPFMIALSFFALFVPGMLANWNCNIFSICPSILVLSVTLWCFESMGQLFGVCFKNAMLGMLAMMGLWFSTFLFMGVMIKQSFIIWPFDILVDILPLKWAVMSLAYGVFHDTVWEGAIETNTSDAGFSCPGMPLTLCSGRTGTQVLRSMSDQFSAASPDDDRLTWGLNIFYIGAVFKLCHILVVAFRVRAVGTIDNDDSDSDSNEDLSTPEKTPFNSITSVAFPVSP